MAWYGLSHTKPAEYHVSYIDRACPADADLADYDGYEDATSVADARKRAKRLRKEGHYPYGIYRLTGLVETTDSYGDRCWEWDDEELVEDVG